MSRALILAAAGSSLLVLSALALMSGSGARAATTTIDVGDEWYCNPGDSACMMTNLGNIDVTTNISVGDTVTWNWVGSLQHTVTQCDATFTTCPSAGGFDSGTQSNGATFP